MLRSIAPGAAVVLLLTGCAGNLTVSPPNNASPAPTPSAFYSYAAFDRPQTALDELPKDWDVEVSEVIPESTRFQGMWEGRRYWVGQTATDTGSSTIGPDICVVIETSTHGQAWSCTGGPTLQFTVDNEMTSLFADQYPVPPPLKKVGDNVYVGDW